MTVAGHLLFEGENWLCPGCGIARRLDRCFTNKRIAIRGIAGIAGIAGRRLALCERNSAANPCVGIAFSP